jgi:hypothetical protein
LGRFIGILSAVQAAFNYPHFMRRLDPRQMKIKKFFNFRINPRIFQGLGPARSGRKKFFQFRISFSRVRLEQREKATPRLTAWDKQEEKPKVRGAWTSF